MKSTISRQLLQKALLVLFLLPLSAFASLPEGVSLTPKPDWVDSVEIIANSSPSPHADSGIEYLYHNRQEKLANSDKDTVQSFTRNVWRYLNTGGVADKSSFSITFNPVYQTVQLHGVTITRNGANIDKLKNARLTLLHRESDTDYLIYNGKKELDIVLSDVRVGDVLDYSFSVIGTNPVFKGLTETIFATSWDSFVSRVDYRVVAPESRELFVRRLNETAVVEKQVERGLANYRISIKDAIPTNYENNTPKWHTSRGYLVISEFSDWQAVAAWEQPLYENAIIANDEVTELAQSFKRKFHTDEKRLVATLKWIQDEIRYLGLSIGESTHVPSNPSTTLARRFGDCKDKTVLLIALLRQMGIEAYPALVSTSNGRKLDDYPFRLHAFDHVLTKVSLAGKTYWLDPTMTYQRGELEDFEQPDFGHALVLEGDMNTLTNMKNATNVMQISSLAEFHLSQVSDIPSRLYVTTNKKGRSAESERRNFASNNKRDLNDSHQDYYEHYYGSAVLNKPIQLAEEAGNVTVKDEYYELEELVLEKPDCDCETFVYADMIHSWLNQPEEMRTRISPYAIDHPIKLEENIVVNTPFALENHSDSIVEDNPYFKFTKAIKTDPEQQTVTMKYTYESKVDHVNPDEIKDYSAAVDKIFDNVSYNVTNHKLESILATLGAEKSDTSQLLWTFGLFLVLSIGAGVYGILRVMVESSA